MRKSFWFGIVVGVLLIISGAFFYQQMPEMVPSHWNVYGEIDGWSGRWIVFLAGAIVLFLNCLLYVVPKIDPKGKNILRSGKGLPFVMIGITLLMVVLQVCTIRAGLKMRVDINKIIPISIGLLFIGIGNYLPKAKQNYAYGIRMSWTLANEEVWTKTHRLGGWLFAIDGLLFIICAFLAPPLNFIIPFVGVGVMVIVPAVYAFLLYNKLEKSK